MRLVTIPKPHPEQNLLKETTVYKLGYAPLPSPLNANVPSQALNRFRESHINLTYSIFSGVVWIIRPVSLSLYLTDSRVCTHNRNSFVLHYVS